ncbi:glycoside hydrolase family protein [Niallia sp. Man26]|uniref:glycoside hydrolase family protein n=1 Tax=Niallia sp. Man26 TaxID=2912824 RepID=UPI001EDBDCF1|nr:glycoside hydrolase family protein [Niallia sp. Man26]UPO88349.1 glycoside hydrolase family protein [Niallia sp. Man26]
MELSTNGLNLIKSFEGVRLTAYKAVSTEEHWTIGYGHYGADVREGQTITKAQADKFLKADVARFESAVNSNVKVALNQNQFDALVSFTYNCGEGALKRSTLLELLNQGKYIEAADQFDLWNKSGGKVLNGLVKRRAKEKALFLTGLPQAKKAEVTSAKTYKLTSGKSAYVSAADAKSQKNKKGAVKAGTYYVFNEFQGMINLTSKKGVAGSWIDPNEDNQEYYVIKSGDTLTKVAKKYKTTVASIKALNPSIKNVNLIYANQKIRVK